MRKRNLRTILTGLAAGGAAAGGLCLLRSEYEKNQLETDYYRILSPKIQGSGKTFVFLTDLHDKQFGTDNERLLAAIRAEKPDAVLIGGDLMVAKGEGDLTVSLALLRKFAADYPVFYSNGNHEDRMRRETDIYGDKYRRYREALRGLGVTYLVNRSVDFGEDIRICGLDLPLSCYRHRKPSLPDGYAKEALGPAPDERFTILLAHSPLFFRRYADWGADLTLAGHFHGGTIRLPVLGGVMTPQFQFFYPWCAGMVQEQEHRMIVGRGLGTHSINIRLNNKPQVVVVRIENNNKI